MSYRVSVSGNTNRDERWKSTMWSIEPALLRSRCQGEARLLVHVPELRHLEILTFFEEGGGLDALAVVAEDLA